ncbi:MAG: response regulator transcription factor, partial [Gammaproteobacteria bacterium]
MPDRSLFLVEDDDTIRENFTELLTESGFSVTSFPGREGVLEQVETSPPDIMLLDIALGNERDGGFLLCSELRKHSEQLPIVFLSSRDSDLDKVSGMRLGADDYITKDSSFEYIIVRIEALLRRVDSFRSANGSSPEAQTSTGNLRLDTERCEAYWNDQKVDITLTHYWMLAAMAEKPGNIKRTSELMNAANIVVEPNTIVAHVKAIRSAFKTIDPDFDCIKT